MNNKRNCRKKITVKKFYKKFYSKRNSTKTNQLIASRNTFRPICTKTLDLKEDDAHIINLQINLFILFIYLFILSLMLTITEKILFTIKIAVKC